MNYMFEYWIYAFFFNLNIFILTKKNPDINKQMDPITKYETAKKEFLPPNGPVVENTIYLDPSKFLTG